MSKKRPEPPEEALAKALRKAYLRAYVLHNTYHEAEGWEELKEASRLSWLHLAKEALVEGVRIDEGKHHG
jgi:hypothetical protein